MKVVVAVVAAADDDSDDDIAIVFRIVSYLYSHLQWSLCILSRVVIWLSGFLVEAMPTEI